jgi:UDP-2-acetamido-3-amino-2,3-dideoxy-glucuronate N-acetyltransferase
MTGFIAHGQAIVESDAIGKGTRIAPYARVRNGAIIGEDCEICEHTLIESDVVIGSRVTIRSGVQVLEGTRIENDVFVGPNATFTNDVLPPRQQLASSNRPATVLRQGCSIGANATLLPGITIGQHAVVGAGAVVTRSVPPHAVVVGNPAQIIRYVEDVATPAPSGPGAVSPRDITIRVPGVQLTHMPLIKDLRGNLLAREIGRGLPFIPKRFFVVMDVPSKEVRGEHAHRCLEQLLVCLRGTITVVVDDGHARQEILLDSPELALYLPPMVWGIQYKGTADAVLLVMASDGYDPDDYIRDYDQFLREKAPRTA